MLERQLLDDLMTICELLEERIEKINHKTCRCWVLMANKLIRKAVEYNNDIESFPLEKYFCNETMKDSLRKVILLLIREKGGEAYRRELAAEIKELFPRFFDESVGRVSNLLSNALCLLESEGLIVNVRRGVWALTPKGEMEAEKLDWEKVIETISPELLVQN